MRWLALALVFLSLPVLADVQDTTPCRAHSCNDHNHATCDTGAADINCKRATNDPNGATVCITQWMGGRESGVDTWSNGAGAWVYCGGGRTMTLSGDPSRFDTLEASANYVRGIKNGVATTQYCTGACTGPQCP